MERLRNKILLIVLIILVIVSGCSDSSQGEKPEIKPNSVVITFEYNKQSGYASNQFAVWIEDDNGKYVKTLYSTRFTVNGGWKERPEALPEWVQRSNLPDKSKEELDAITGATPKPGNLVYIWDCTNDQGESVPAGTYSFFVEGSLRWTARVLFTGKIIIGGENTEATAISEYFGEDGEERNMITEVKAVYTP